MCFAFSRFVFSRTGVGRVSEEQVAKGMSRIFDRFYRADNSRSKSRLGSGLGLAIVKSIMQLHHGSSSISSEPGKGTTVVLSFPA